MFTFLFIRTRKFSYAHVYTHRERETHARIPIAYVCFFVSCCGWLCFVMMLYFLFWQHPTCFLSFHSIFYQALRSMYHLCHLFNFEMLLNLFWHISFNISLFPNGKIEFLFQSLAIWMFHHPLTPFKWKKTMNLIKWRDKENGNYFESSITLRIFSFYINCLCYCTKWIAIFSFKLFIN